ncbi:unnamed protein product [Mytilus edulis]|uniref:Reverse transcriptase zinc-binding domain-containing protein n=1 Tax=Mytilus edulis TaxID=6550 RepID=A0A8S3UW98_MYTED|nr:unnamed protein product [Mytilus edulis]
MKKICIKYSLENPLSLLYIEMSKGKWKKLTTTAVHKYWTTRINEEIMYYSSLKYIPTSLFKVGKIHPLALANSANQRDINRIPIRIKIATGTYILQTNRAAYNQNNVDPTCKLCDQAEESLSHFLLCCRALDQFRTPILKNIICKCSELPALQHSNIQLDILQLIINPFHYACSAESENDISYRIEPLCRQLIYKLHNKSEGAPGFTDPIKWNNFLHKLTAKLKIDFSEETEVDSVRTSYLPSRLNPGSSDKATQLKLPLEGTTIEVFKNVEKEAISGRLQNRSVRLKDDKAFMVLKKIILFSAKTS